MRRTPEFDDLVGGVESADERERLLRVHELLVAAGPPPELSPVLASSPAAPAREEAEDPRGTQWLPRRRLGTSLLVGFAALAAAFGAGYLSAGSSDDAAPAPSTFAATEVVSLRPDEGSAAASIRLGRKDANGNWPMIVTVRGLQPLRGGDYYTLALARKGKPVVTCGTFNVAGRGATTVRMVAAYDLKGFDGWVITRYDEESHVDRVLLDEV